MNKFLDNLLDNFQKDFDKYRFAIKLTLVGSVCLIVLMLLLICFGICMNCYQNFFKELETEPQKSIEKIDFMLKFAPKSSYLYSLKGHAYANLEQYDNVLKYFEKSLELKKEAHTYSGIAVATFIKEKKITPEILDLFNKAFELEPNAPNIYFARSCVYYVAGEYDKSLADLEKLYMLTHDGQYISRSADVYLMKGDYCKAYEYYESFDKEFGSNSINKDFAKFRCNK